VLRGRAKELKRFFSWRGNVGGNNEMIHICSTIITIGFSLTTIFGQAQTPGDKFEIYDKVLTEYTSSRKSVCVLLDSTVIANYSYSRWNDSLLSNKLGLKYNDVSGHQDLGDTIVEFSKTREPMPIELTRGGGLKLVSAVILDSIVKTKVDSIVGYRLDEFYEDVQALFGGSTILRVSKPYFVNKDFAIIYSAYQSGPLNGATYVYYFERVEKAWTVYRKVRLTIS
jgi:hypothetical protein